MNDSKRPCNNVLDVLRFPHASSAAVLAAILSTPSAAAKGLTVQYEAPPGCPDVDWFVARVRGRTALAVFSKDGVLVSVKVAAADGVYDARVRTEDESGHELQRAVEGATCTEAVDAIALVIALAIDPEAKLAPAPVPADAVAPSEPKAPPVTVRADALPATRFAPAVTAKAVFSAGATSAALIANAPTVLGGAAAFVEMDTKAQRLFAPSVRLAVSYATSMFDAAPLARFSRLTVNVEGCPVRLGAPEGWSARACATASFGAFRAIGVEIDRPQPVTRPWLDAGAVVRARLAQRAIFLEAWLGVFVPLVRDTFVFETPRVVVFEMPPLCGTVGLGAGVRFL